MRSVISGAVLIWLLSLATSSARLDGALPFIHLSQDGKRIFVMVSEARYYNENPEKFTLPDGRVVLLNQTFTQSGLYDAATFSPIWQVDWYSNEEDVLFSPDCTDLVRRDRHGLKSGWALKFYHEGRPTRTYGCGELLTALKSWEFLPFTTWGYHYAWYDDFEVKENRLLLSTARRRLALGYHLDLGLQEFYTFDLSTGVMLNRSVTGRDRLHRVTLALVFSLLLTGVSLLRWAWRRWKREPEPET